MRDLDEIKAIALEYGKREAPSILAKGEGDEGLGRRVLQGVGGGLVGIPFLSLSFQQHSIRASGSCF